ncbi:sugar phosphate isomerase/epimerase family protein [Gryllotalpicola reticulitermitis]|uniref:Sugar phosphate isomerase/epimerase family protein n=1 Tax=Gryllotalpicola reticulitermitis TaxID=1184153 RepID=A0ABV8Q653_9MICO
MPFTRDNWPILAALLPFPVAQNDSPEQWLSVFHEVADAGFDAVDLTDSWVRPGDLDDARLADLRAAYTEAGLRAPAISAIRRSVIDAKNGEDNLAYSHRTLEAAAELGVEVVSFGLHQALTAEQQQQLWFWTVEGHKDPVGDRETWNLAVTRLRELGQHAAQLGIVMTLEMYEDTYLGTGASSVRLVEDIGLQAVGLNPDVGNLVRLHRPIEDWRELLHMVLPYTNYWHVKNYFRDEDPAQGSYVALPAPLELGIINYRAAVKEAISAGFQGMFCTEHYGGDGLSVSATNRDYLRRILPAADGYEASRSRVAQNANDLTNLRVHENES